MQSLSVKKPKDKEVLDYPVPNTISPIKKKSSKIMAPKKPSKR